MSWRPIFSSMFREAHFLEYVQPFSQYVQASSVHNPTCLSSSSSWCKTFCCSMVASLPNCSVVLILTSSCQTDRPMSLPPPPFHSPCWSNRSDELSCSQFDPFLVDHIMHYLPAFLVCFSFMEVLIVLINLTRMFLCSISTSFSLLSWSLFPSLM